MNNATYLLTGAAGFFGSHICRQLVERGEKVRALVLDGECYLLANEPVSFRDFCRILSEECGCRLVEKFLLPLPQPLRLARECSEF